ncbi:MAG: SDR family NAD(P)-dependent oxidoreductase, partial [Clostridia bacterium]|nr:SDR family NAD(P)-dependent oxidoreductase [Clostridia bacterium]
MNVSRWIKVNTQALGGRTVVITGATGGLGGAVCRHLLSLGAGLILLDRNRAKSDALKAALIGEYPQATIRQIPLDLSDMASVKAACEALERETFDVLIHNAGAYSIPRCICNTGYDNVFQINFASPYYMTCRLLPLLRERGGRVVAVGSIAHNYSKTDAVDVDFRTRKKASLVYGNAKRYLMYALHELFRDEDRATFAVTHPGITFTNITAHYPPLIFALIKYPMKVIFMSPRRAALSIIRGVFEASDYRTWIGPRLFDVWGVPSVKPLRTAQNEEIAR